ncbi:MAG: hypothetical protein AAGI70_09675, partial [Pseudomonadota bacterium]
QQAALFERLRADPANLDLMAEYARVSILLEDYEAAISTLERMLIYNQDLPTVRRELGVAYFNIGSYQAAELYLRQVLTEDDLPPEVRQNVEAYLAEIDRRADVSRITSFVAGGGVIYSTNATFGPEGLLDSPIGAIAIDSTNGAKEADVGLRAFASVVHDYDLQGPNSDFWRTQGSFQATRYFEENEGSLEFFNVRTGPFLSLDDNEFGPKLRPYIAASHLSFGDESLYLQAGFGLEVLNTLSSTWTAFADVGVNHRNLTDGTLDGLDTFRITSLSGLAYIPSRNLTVRGAFVFEQEFAGDDENTNTEVGIRISGNYQYESGFQFVDAPWSASASLDLRGRFFPEEQISLGLTEKRRDFDVVAGFAHVFGITENFGLQVDLTALYRESNIRNFDLDNISVGLSALYRM